MKQNLDSNTLRIVTKGELQYGPHKDLQHEFTIQGPEGSTETVKRSLLELYSNNKLISLYINLERLALTIKKIQGVDFLLKEIPQFNTAISFNLLHKYLSSLQEKIMQVDESSLVRHSRGILGTKVEGFECGNVWWAEERYLIEENYFAHSFYLGLQNPEDSDVLYFKLTLIKPVEDYEDEEFSLQIYYGGRRNMDNLREVFQRNAYNVGELTLNGVLRRRSEQTHNIRKTFGIDFFNIKNLKGRLSPDNIRFFLSKFNDNIVLAKNPENA